MIAIAQTPHMFAHGFEAARFGVMCDTVKRPLYGADCYAYALVASGFGADIVVESDLGLYDYCALVPVVEGAGGIMTDWNGNRLTLQHHEASRGRVIASANKNLHAEAVQVLQDSVVRQLTSSTAYRTAPPVLLGVAAGTLIGMALALTKGRANNQ